MCNRLRVAIGYWAAFSLLLSCGKSNSELDAKLKLCVGTQMDSIQNKAALIVIPLNGCGSCIEKMKFFFRNNHESPNMYFLFSGAYERDIRIELIKDSLLISKQNVIIKGGYFSDRNGITDSNPAIFYLENGKAIQHVKVTPFDVDESLHNLEEYLK